MTTHRRNARNESLTLRALLKVACRELTKAKVTLPEPLAAWWLAQRNMAWVKLPRVHAGPSGLTVDLVQQEINKIS